MIGLFYNRRQRTSLSLAHPVALSLRRITLYNSPVNKVFTDVGLFTT